VPLSSLVRPGIFRLSYAGSAGRLAPSPARVVVLFLRLGTPNHIPLSIPPGLGMIRVVWSRLTNLAMRTGAPKVAGSNLTSFLPLSQAGLSD